MNYAGNTEMIRKHFHDHQENVYCCAFNHFFAQNILSLTKVIFIKELSKIFKDYGGKFEDIMLFQGLFKARANHVINLQLFLKLLISFIPRMGC